MNRIFKPQADETMCEGCQASFDQGQQDARDNRRQIVRWIMADPTILLFRFPVPQPHNANELHNSQAYCQGYGECVQEIADEWRMRSQM